MNMESGSGGGHAVVGMADARVSLPVSVAVQVERFFASALIVPMGRSAAGGAARIPPEKAEALQEAALASMRAVGRPELAAALYDRLITHRLDDEVWYSTLADGRCVILVREEISAAMEEREIAAYVHMSELRSAALRGEPVNTDLVAHYEQMRARSRARAQELN